MKLITWTFDRLALMDRPPEYLSEVLACCVSNTETSVTVDEESECMRLLREKYRGKPKGWRGLGDVVASATKAVGIAPCGKCKKRQAALNKLLPFK